MLAVGSSTIVRSSPLYRLKHSNIKKKKSCPIAHAQLDTLRGIYQHRTWWAETRCTAEADECRRNSAVIVRCWASAGDGGGCHRYMSEYSLIL